MENKKQGYLGRTGYGTEAKVRARLKDSGISEFEIEKLFKNARAV